jgi:hypothetical protein
MRTTRRSLLAFMGATLAAQDVKLARRFNPQVAATLEGYPDDEVWSRIAVMRRSDGQEDQAENPRLAEFAMLASGQPVIGTPTPDALLRAETLPRTTWDPGDSPLLQGLSSLIAVHWLREVACLYGFTRFEPAPVVTEDFEDVGLAVRGAPLARNPTWLPAVEQFGIAETSCEARNLFLDRALLASWLQDAKTIHGEGMVKRRTYELCPRARLDIPRQAAPWAPARTLSVLRFSGSTMNALLPRLACPVQRLTG